MRLGPVTALCISRLHSALRKLFRLLWSATYEYFFFWLCFETPLHSYKCVYLPESEKDVTLKQL